MRPRPKKFIRVTVSEGNDHWIIKLPDREIVARDRTMVNGLVRAYATARGMIAVIEWQLRSR